MKARPTPYWWCLFAAIPLGCAAAVLRSFGTPSSPALKQRCAGALMRYESIRAYLHETARGWRFAAPPEMDQRVLRAKTYVSEEATRIASDLFALSGGRHYTRSSAVARAFSDSFAGTSLRPPLPLALDQIAEAYSSASIDG